MFVTIRQRNTSSISGMLKHLNWNSFQDSRNAAWLVMMYKIANENLVTTKKKTDTFETITTHALFVFDYRSIQYMIDPANTAH